LANRLRGGIGSVSIDDSWFSGYIDYVNRWTHSANEQHGGRAVAIIHPITPEYEMDTRYSKVIKAKDRTYFVDVREQKNSTPYLVITESRKSKDEANKYTKSAVMMYKEQSIALMAALNEAAAFMA
jgi:hypothetical protein